MIFSVLSDFAGSHFRYAIQNTLNIVSYFPYSSKKYAEANMLFKTSKFLRELDTNNF